MTSLDIEAELYKNRIVPHAILFDMDDTIILWETPYQAVWESAIRRFKVKLGDLTPEKLYETIRSVGNWYWSDPERHRAGRLDLLEARRELTRMAFNRLGRSDLELAEKIADVYSFEREQCGTISAGTTGVLANLRKRGIRLAMITNGSAELQRAKIEKFNLSPFFEYILIEGEFGCGKPDERVFRHALDKLGVPPSDAWMVGNDLEFDIAPCRNLGIYGLWVDAKNNGLPPETKVRPDKIIRGITEIPDLLKEGASK